jgi:hypothetical protein
VRRTAIVAAVALLVGLLAGYFTGRLLLEREWSQPEVLLRQDQAARSAGGGADPTPAAGTRVLRPMPLSRSRLALAGLTARAPVVATVGSVGRSGGAMELHLTLRNRGRCRVARVEGVAYGFDAIGRPAKMNRAGEHYLAFAGGEPIEPGQSVQAAWPLHFPDVASLAVAHVDRVQCTDGTRWARN